MRSHHHSQSDQLSYHRKCAESVLGPIDWQSEHKGFCRCPGQHFHTKSNGPRDCMVHLDGSPRLYCFHNLCQKHVRLAISELRLAIYNIHAPFSSRPQPTDFARQYSARQGIEQQSLERLIHEMLPGIIKGFEWEDVIEHKLLPKVQTPQRFLAAMYRPTDVIWTGERFHTGKETHACHFQTVADWQASEMHGPLVCPSTFKPNIYSRSNANVLHRPYLVLDGDEVDPECRRKNAQKIEWTPEDKFRNLAASVALLNFLNLDTGLKLVAIVDAGNKSAHGWFRWPEERLLNHLTQIMKHLGFDPSMLRPAQPARLPGVIRPDTGRMQKLLYLNRHEL